MHGVLTVEPNQLENAADDFSLIMGQIANVTSEMMSQVSGLNAKWQGEASSAYLNKFNQLEDDINRIKAMIQEHVNDLKQMAQVYEQTESINEGAVQALSGDVLI